MSSIQKTPLCVDLIINLIDFKNMFQTGHLKDIAHMEIVCKDVKKVKQAISSVNRIPTSRIVTGVITLEHTIKRLTKK